MARLVLLFVAAIVINDVQSRCIDCGGDSGLQRKRNPQSGGIFNLEDYLPSDALIVDSGSVEANTLDVRMLIYIQYITNLITY